MNNKFMQYLAGAALLAVSGVASAQSTCASTLSTYNSYLSVGDIAGAQHFVSKHPQCFGGTVSSQAMINATTVALSGAISGSVSNRMLSAGGPDTLASIGTSGMAAGAPVDKWNVWGNLSGNNTKVSYSNDDGTTTKSNNEILTTMVGVDYALSPTMVLGLSGAFDNGNGSGQTAANAAQGISSSGYLLAPYLAMQLSKDLVLDASVGIGNGTMTIAGDTKNDASRLFGAANLSYSRWFQNIQLTGKLGYLHAEEDHGDTRTNGVVTPGTKNRNRLDQFRAGVQAGYWMNGVMPYAAFSFATDSRSSSNQALAVNVVGKNAALWTLGVNVFSLSSKVTGGIAYSHETSRSNSVNDIIMANINVRF